MGTTDTPIVLIITASVLIALIQCKFIKISGWGTCFTKQVGYKLSPDTFVNSHVNHGSLATYK